MSSFAALMALGVLASACEPTPRPGTAPRSEELPADMRPGDPAPPSPLELYCDFTGDRGAVSDRLSRRCVERDLDRVRLAFRDRMTFVVVEHALTRIPRNSRDGQTCPGPSSWPSSHQCVTIDVSSPTRTAGLTIMWPTPMASTSMHRDQNEFLRDIQSAVCERAGKLLDILDSSTRSGR